jgi:hypothetical protein
VGVGEAEGVEEAEEDDGDASGGRGEEREEGDAFESFCFGGGVVVVGCTDSIVGGDGGKTRCSPTFRGVKSRTAIGRAVRLSQNDTRLIAQDMHGGDGEHEAEGRDGGADEEERLELEGGDFGYEPAAFQLWL